MRRKEAHSGRNSDTVFQTFGFTSAPALPAQIASICIVDSSSPLMLRSSREVS
jgi:hypothetical protein